MVAIEAVPSSFKRFGGWDITNAINHDRSKSVSNAINGGINTPSFNGAFWLGGPVTAEAIEGFSRPRRPFTFSAVFFHAPSYRAAHAFSARASLASGRSAVAKRSHRYSRDRAF